MVRAMATSSGSGGFLSSADPGRTGPGPGATDHPCGAGRPLGSTDSVASRWRLCEGREVSLSNSPSGAARQVHLAAERGIAGDRDRHQLLQLGQCEHRLAAIEIDAGKTIVQGNTFADGETHIRVAEGVESAIITVTRPRAACGGEPCGARTQAVANELSPIVWTKDAKLHYASMSVPRATGPMCESGMPRRPGRMDRPTVHQALVRSRVAAGVPVVKGRKYTLTSTCSCPGRPSRPTTGSTGRPAPRRVPRRPGSAVITATIPAVKTEQLVLTLRCKGCAPRSGGGQPGHAHHRHRRAPVTCAPTGRPRACSMPAAAPGRSEPLTVRRGGHGLCTAASTSLSPRTTRAVPPSSLSAILRACNSPTADEVRGHLRQPPARALRSAQLPAPLCRTGE